MGGNKAYIENVLPHISGMISESLEDVVSNSDVVVVAHDLQDGERQLVGILRPDQLVLDLVKMKTNGSQFPAAYEGVCW
jgi:GDP-mannose 6-dehydrogenase